MSDGVVQGETSTGSKRITALFGPGPTEGLPLRVRRSAGCTVWDQDGRPYLDCIMALGAVGLGYGHPAVNRAAIEAIESGVVGPLAPVLEEELASDLARIIPWIERVQFLKSGAEAVAAAVRIARAATGRDLVLGCGYHGWLDWCRSVDAGVPGSTRSLYGELRFNDADGARDAIRSRGDRLAAVVVEPVIEGEPSRAWLAVLREETHKAGAVLVFDEIKTAFRIALGGAGERYGVHPDLVVLGKALANGFPLAAVGGARNIMEAAARTWISSTLATEMVALAAARATLSVMQGEKVPSRLTRSGQRLWDGLADLAGRHPSSIRELKGVPEMCYLAPVDEALGSRLARAAAGRGLLFKRSAYNFVSLAHGDEDIDRALNILDDALRSLDAD